VKQFATSQQQIMMTIQVKETSHCKKGSRVAETSHWKKNRETQSGDRTAEIGNGGKIESGGYSYPSARVGLRGSSTYVNNKIMKV